MTRWQRIARIAMIALLCVAVAGTQAFAQFETRAIFNTGNYDRPDAFVVGDFNRDGILDVAVVGYYRTGRVTIFLGNGDGTFRTGASYVVGLESSLLTAASLRNNGILDLVVGDTLYNRLHVMLGNGDGTFQPQVTYPSTARAIAIGTGDFTGDGNLDIVDLTGYPCYCLEVLPGNGDGTFGAGVVTLVPTKNGMYGLSAGDFNEDGKLDLVVSAFDLVYTFLGNGDGSFRLSNKTPVPETPTSIAIGQFRTGNKPLDLVIAAPDGVSVLLGNGDGSFPSGATYGAWLPDGLAVGDLNGDGNEDVVVTDVFYMNNLSASAITVLSGNGDGTLLPGVVYPAGVEVGNVAIGDVNGDGLPDLLALDGRGAIITLLNTGTVSFSPTAPLTFPTELISTTSAPLTATLTNNGTSALTISSTSYTGKPFHVQNNCPTSIAPGGSCIFTATYFPTVAGVNSGSITINNSASSKPQVILLQGTATQVNLQPTQLTFPATKNGSKSKPQKVQLTNVGSTAVDIITIAIGEGSDFRDFYQSNDCGTTVAAGASCTISVIFAPRRTGTFSETVVVYDNGGGSPQSVALTGTGD